MKKIKLFLEFVSGNKKSKFLDKTYQQISEMLNCSIDEVEDFEKWLNKNIKPGQIFHGSFESEEGNLQAHPMFDKIETEGDYIEMWQQYNPGGMASHAHSDEGL